MIFRFVFLYGFYWHMIYQGPSALEILTNLRRTSGPKACTVDRVYLHFQLTRVIRLLIGLSMLSCVLFLAFFNLAVTVPIHPTVAVQFIGVSVVIALAAVARVWVISKRVAAERFGTTEYEARTLLAFLSKLKESSGQQFDPPGRLSRVTEAVDPIKVPTDARLAHE